MKLKLIFLICLSVAFVYLHSSSARADPTLESFADFFSNSKIVHLVEPSDYWEEQPSFQSSMDYWIQGDLAYKQLHYLGRAPDELVLVKDGRRTEYIADNEKRYSWDIKRLTSFNNPAWRQIIIRSRQGRLRKVRETDKVSYYDIKKLVRMYRAEPRSTLPLSTLKTFLLAIEKASGRPLFFRIADDCCLGLRNYSIKIESRLPSSDEASVFDINEITKGRQPDRYSTPIGFTRETISGQVSMPLYWLGESIRAYKLLSANRIDGDNMKGYTLSYGRGRQKVEPSSLGGAGDLTVHAEEFPKSDMAEFRKVLIKGKRKKYKYRGFSFFLFKSDGADLIYLFKKNHIYIINWYGGESVKRARRFLNAYWKPLV